MSQSNFLNRWARKKAGTIVEPVKEEPLQTVPNRVDKTAQSDCARNILALSHAAAAAVGASGAIYSTPVSNQPWSGTPTQDKSPSFSINP